MNAHSLFASASINIGVAFFILSLFSIFKKFSSNSLIYYARRLANPEQQHHISFNPSFTLSSLFPSFSWIPRAFRVTEDEILQSSGLDALVVLRLFKFGVKFFLPCSIVGLVVLLPVNYNHIGPVRSKRSHSMDSFTISNIGIGSNWLWVHFSCLCIISFYGFYLLHKEYSEIFCRRIQHLHNAKHRPDQYTVLVREIPFCNEHKSYGCCVDRFFSKHYPYMYQSYQMVYDGKVIEDLLELPVAFVSFKSRWGAAIASQSQLHENPLLWITQLAPEPRDVVWNNLAIRYRCLPLTKIGVFLAASLLTIFFAFPVTAVQGIVRFEKLKQWFPPAMAIQFIPGLSSVVTGYLPSAILNLFIYIVPFAMVGLGALQGYVSRNQRDIKACNMVFYFLVGNVFFLSLLSGSLLDQIGKSFTNPKDFPSHLASAVSAQADFFMTYILTDGLSGFSLEILQFGLLTLDFLRVHTFGRGKNKNPYLFSFPYYRVIPSVSLSILIGMVYVVVAPLLLPFLIVYLLLGYVVYINQIQDVYEIVYETGGLYWPYIHHYIIISIALMQITMIGLFGLKSKPSASISTIPLLLLTLLFNEYCKMRFLPTFFNYSIQTAVENDEQDQMNGLTEVKGPRVNGFRCKETSNVTADDFFFAGLANPGATNNTMGSLVTGANVQRIPGLNTLGVSLSRIDYAPHGLNPPHVHPRATEIVFVLKGQLEVGFITTSNTLYSKTIKEGEIFVFPKGLVHFQMNNGSEPASAIAAFNSQLPGTQSLAATLFAATPTVPDAVLTKAFQIGTKEVEKIKTNLAP